MTKKQLKNCAIRACTAIFALLATVALFIGCEEKPDEKNNALLDGAFRADVSVSYGNFSFCGVLEADEVKSDGIERDAKFEFTLPESLSGITAERKDGKVTLSLDGMNADCNLFSEMLSFLRLFEPSCDRSISFDGTVPRTVKENADGGAVCEIKSFEYQ